MSVLLPRFGFLALSILGLAGCGAPPPAAAPPAAAPGATPQAPPPPSEAPAVSATASASPTGPATTASAIAPSQPPAETPPPKSVRSLSDVLTASSVAYMLNYGESAPKEAAEKLCASRAGEDLGKRAECMEKERERVAADVLVFGKSGKAAYFIVYRRAHNTLTELSKSQIEFAKETDNAVVVKIKSDKGTRPIFAGKKELVVSAASDSSIQLDDPQLGKLLYEARIGLIDKPSE